MGSPIPRRARLPYAGLSPMRCEGRLAPDALHADSCEGLLTSCSSPLLCSACAGVDLSKHSRGKGTAGEVASPNCRVQALRKRGVQPARGRRQTRQQSAGCVARAIIDVCEVCLPCHGHGGGMVARGVCHALCSPLRGSPPGAVVLLRGAPADTSECTIGHPRWSSGEETMNAKHCSRMAREGERVAEAVFAVPSPRLMSPSRSRIRPPRTRFVTLAHRRVWRYREAHGDRWSTS